MGITVEDLVALSELGTTVLAGASGLGREIGWAHVCELPAPWDWLGAGDLLMTTGLGIPPAARDQVEFFTRVAGAGMVGVAVGQDMHAPPLSPEAIAAADAAGLPLLETRYEIPFVALARAVAGANQQEERERLTRTQRLYEQMRLLTADTQLPTLLSALSREVGASLAVADPRSNLVAGASSDDALTTELLDELRSLDTQSRPALIRLRTGGAVALALPAPRPSFLVARPLSGGSVDVGLLQHVAAVVATQRAAAVAGRERARRVGASLLAQLVDGRIDPVAAHEQLGERGLAGALLVVSACSGDEADPDLTGLHHVLDDAGFGHLLLTRAHITYALTSVGEPVDLLTAAVPATGRVGVSEPFTAVTAAPEAHRQARWSLHVAQVRQARFARYGEDSGASAFLPRSLEESSDVAREVIGTLLDYDAAHDSRLVESLQVFLEENRSWQRAAARLIIHKQTLVYRMERVEQITGRRLDRIADVTDLWLALQAATAAGLLDPSD
ncbi:MAG: PucR family transcriptional regulator [Blastococcus sp.]